MLEASWRSLDDGERDALVRCAVFRGGFSEDAVVAVLALDDLAEARAVLDALAAESLVVRSRQRWDVPNDVRAFAHALAPEDTLATARRLHASWFAAQAVGWLGRWERDGSRQPLDELEAEQENLLAALDFAAIDDAPGAAQLLFAIDALDASRGPIPHLFERLERLVAGAAELSPPVAERLLFAAESALSRGASRRRPPTELLPIAHVALVAARTLGVERLELALLARVGWISLDAGELDRADRAFEAAARVAARLDDAIAEGQNVAARGIVRHARAEHDAACALYRTALDLLSAEDAGPRNVHVVALLSAAEASRGRVDHARRHLDTTLAMAAAGAPHGEVHATIARAQLALAACRSALTAGRPDRARPWLEDAEEHVESTARDLHAMSREEVRAALALVRDGMQTIASGPLAPPAPANVFTDRG